MNREMLTAMTVHKFEHHLDEMKEELLLAALTPDVEKDIIIVVKDQLEYMQNCVDSIYENTDNFTLYIWDNASETDTKDYLESLVCRGNVKLFRSEINQGFNEPNNRLAEKTTAPYIIPLNSDTIVRKGWDRLMVGFLQRYPDVKIVGYGGSRLNEEFKGGPAHYGYDIDYVAGWGFCMSRDTYNQFGVFDETNLHFAYCEDSDLSLRVREAGYKVYALHVDLVLHFENKAMKKVVQDATFRKWFLQNFEANHAYMKRRWSGKGLVFAEQEKT